MDTFEAVMKRSISLTAIVRITRTEPPVGKHVTKRRFIRKYLFARLHLRALQGVCDTPLHFAAINRKQVWAKKHIDEVMRGYNYILLSHLELYKR